MHPQTKLPVRRRPRYEEDEEDGVKDFRDTNYDATVAGDSLVNEVLPSTSSRNLAATGIDEVPGLPHTIGNVWGLSRASAYCVLWCALTLCVTSNDVFVVPKSLPAFETKINIYKFVSYF